MLKAVIFDFDGLILETETPELRSWEEVFQGHGVEYPEWYWRHSLGRGEEQIEKTPYDLIVELGVQVDQEDLYTRRNAIKQRMLDLLEVQPGVLDRLAEARMLNMGVGIASSSKHPWVDGHLKRLGLLEYFDEIVCADDVPRAKPFPDLYLKCCERLGVAPYEAVALEDSANGVLAAKKAGMYVVAVPTHLTIRAELTADLVVESLEDVSLGRLIEERGKGKEERPEA